MPNDELSEVGVIWKESQRLEMTRGEYEYWMHHPLPFGYTILYVPSAQCLDHVEEERHE